MSYSTHIIDLPSTGIFYAKDSPLSKGKIELRTVTASEEDILTSANLIRQGTAIDKFLEAIIVTSINLDDILICDKNAVIIASRVLAYGPEYEVEIKCPSCGNVNSHIVNLTLIETKDIDLSYAKQGVSEYEYTLPSGIVITHKFLTQADDKVIDVEVGRLKKIDNTIDREFTTRLRHLITSVSGKKDSGTVNEFVSQMSSRDSLALRKHLRKITPDVDMTFKYVCKSCGVESIVPIPMETEFFWPKA